MKQYFEYAKTDTILSFGLLVALILHYGNIVSNDADTFLMIVVGLFSTVLVAWSAIKSLFAKEISIDLLASVALVFSLIAHEWVSAVFISLMLSAARILQKVTTAQTKRSIESLFKLRPANAKRINDGIIEIVPIENISIGDMLVVELGERVPVDGYIYEGTASVDESTLTGESLPVDKEVGSKVFCSTVIVSGNAKIIVEKLGKDTTLEKIIALVESSGEKKPHFETVGVKFGKIYLIGILITAFIVLYITGDTNFVLAVILIICADDVAVAIPLAYLSATREAAKRGVVIKGSGYLEALGKIDTIVFDKTGTLTTGKLKLADIIASEFSNSEEVFSVSLALAKESNHPISKAICVYATGKKFTPIVPEKVDEIGGMGIMGVCDGKNVIFGRSRFMDEKKVEIGGELNKEVEKLENMGKSVSYVAINGRMVGILAFTDEIRPETKKTIERLRTLGVKKIIMLTGDNERVAKTVADKIGIKTVHAHLLPEDKVKHMEKYIKDLHMVAMVGDGANDAATLRLATVGIAMGAIGYDTAIEAADIVLMRDDISKIADVIKLARLVKRISYQDFAIWGASNIFGLSLVFGGLIGPAGAAAYNFVTDFFPLFNSLRPKTHSMVSSLKNHK